MIAINSILDKQVKSSPILYNDQIKAINQQYIKLNFAEHIHNIGHKYTNIQMNLQIPPKAQKGPTLNAFEQFEMFNLDKNHENELLKYQLHTIAVYYKTSSHRNRTSTTKLHTPIYHLHSKL